MPLSVPLWLNLAAAAGTVPVAVRHKKSQCNPEELYEICWVQDCFLVFDSGSILFGGGGGGCEQKMHKGIFGA